MKDKSNGHGEKNGMQSPVNSQIIAPEEFSPLAISPRKNRMRRWVARKWLYPALYFSVATLVMGGMWLYDQQTSGHMSDQTQISETNVAVRATDLDESQDFEMETTADDETQVEAVASDEKLTWPVIADPILEVSLPYYNKSDTEPAMVTYQDTIRPHVGVDFVRKDHEAFDVLATMSGVVSNVSQDPLVGKFVVIDHSNGVQTIYQSIDDIRVSKGEQVAQGQLIARSSNNELEKKQGNHLHFEVRENGAPVDPSKMIKE